MSGTLRAGLIFGLVALIAVIVVGFIPAISALLCSPASALIIGGIAGYYAIRWTLGQAGVGQGALAGSIVGVGALIGTVLLWIILIGMAQNDPTYQDAINQALEQQGANGEVDPAVVQGLLNASGPIAGVCFGIISLIAALVGGLFGALIANNRRPAPPPAAPPSIPPMS